MFIKMKICKRHSFSELIIFFIRIQIILKLIRVVQQSSSRIISRVHLYGCEIVSTVFPNNAHNFSDLVQLMTLTSLEMVDTITHTPICITHDLCFHYESESLKLNTNSYQLCIFNGLPRKKLVPCYCLIVIKCHVWL